MNDDTLRGYTLEATLEFDPVEAEVTLVCDRCHEDVASVPKAPLLDVVQAAVEHSGRCLE